MGSNGNGKHGTSRDVMVFVGRDDSINSTKIVVHDADNQEALVMILVPDGILSNQVSNMAVDGDVLKSLKQLLESCFGAVIQSMDNVLDSE
jgi:alpha-N-acetylglucosamine transferase